MARCVRAVWREILNRRGRRESQKI